MTPGTLHKRPAPSSASYILAATCACGHTHDCATTSPREAADVLRDAGWLWLWTRERKGWTCPDCVVGPKRTPGPLPNRALAQLAALYDGTRAWVEADRADLDALAVRLLVQRGLVEREERYGRSWVRISERGVRKLDAARIEVTTR